MNAKAPKVSVVIPFFNALPFLGEAVESVFAQTFGDWELLLVDDGSRDGSAEEARRWAGKEPGRVRYLEHAGHRNRGISATLNLGLAHARGDYFAWLDADDVCLPRRLEEQVATLDESPELGMVFGRTQFWYSWTGRPDDRWRDDVPPLGVKPGAAIEPPRMLERMLASNARVPCPCSTLMRRGTLERIGGFEDRFATNHSDQAVYAKLFLAAPVLARRSVWARYRRHERSTIARLKRSGRRPQARLSFLEWLEAYVSANAYDGCLRPALDEALARARSRIRPPSSVSPGRILRRLVPPSVRTLIRRQRGGRAFQPPPGSVRCGDLRRLEPFSRRWGAERGTPVDRYYIEQFLARHSSDIRGRVMEVGDDRYTWRFGGLEVTDTDVLDVRDTNPDATLVADLGSSDPLPSDRFDCIVFTQTLHLFFEPGAVIQKLRQMLKPSGVLLLTVPGITPIGRPGDWGESWYWSFTPVSARRLLERFFPEGALTVEARGNLMSATGFLYGLAAQELTSRELEHEDPRFPVSILVRAVKGGAPA